MWTQDQVSRAAPQGWPAQLLAGPWHCGGLSCRLALASPWLRALGQEVFP